MIAPPRRSHCTGADADAHCVIHAHSTHLVAASLAHVGPEDNLLLPIAPYFVTNERQVPLIPYCRSPVEASAVLEELEETARLWRMTRAAPLSADQIDELRQQFGARW